MAFKSIEILTEQVKTPFTKDPVEMTTLDLLKEILNAGGALTRKEMKLRDKAELALENTRTYADVTGDYIELEEEDFNTFKRCADEFVWTFRAPFISKFLNLFD